MLINMKSGTKSSKNNLLGAIDVFCKYGYTVTTYITQKANDAYEYLLNNQIEYDIVCVFGGDGTMNEVSNALMRKEYKPKIGYFPSGTMNDFGSNFNLGSDFKAIAERICNGKENSYDVGLCNDQYFNYVAAFGAMCDVPYSTDRNAKEMLGIIAYILEGINKLGEIKKVGLKYKIDDKEYESDVLFGLVFSGNRVSGIELDIEENMAIDDGLFTVIIVDYIAGLFDAPDLLALLLESDKHIHVYRTNNICLNFDDKVPFTLDGEKADIDGVADIKLIPAPLKLIA